ncbi:MAG: hypothetical protein LBC18_09785, partial [Opitutaceae bacterium]|nr:hypothetical protein [Opitutaceae bacterium]
MFSAPFSAPLFIRCSFQLATNSAPPPPGACTKPGAAVPDSFPKWAGATAACDLAANGKPPLAETSSPPPP